MNKYIYDENNGCWYELQGDYYISYLTLLTEKESKLIGVWERWRLRYIRERRKVFHTNPLISRKLQSTLLMLRNKQGDGCSC